MIRMRRLTDYGILLLTVMARDTIRPVHNARELAKDAKLPLPTVRKILKLLAHNGLLDAHRGVKGGFNLARPAAQVTMTDIIKALEGPIGITDCSAHTGSCGLENLCIVSQNWRTINRVVLDALNRITLAEMAQPRTIAMAPVEFRGARLSKSI